MFWVRPDREIFPDLPHTSANTQLYDAGMVVVCQKLGRIVAYPPDLELGTDGVQGRMNGYWGLGGSKIICANLCITLSYQKDRAYNFVHKYICDFQYPLSRAYFSLIAMH